MPIWLIDPDTTTYLLLIVLLFAALGNWIRSRKRGAGFAVGIVALLLLALYLCDRLYESPREESVRKVQLMVDAFNSNNWEQFQQHLSHGTLVRGVTVLVLKPTFQLGTRFNAKVTVWNFDRGSVKYLTGPEPAVEIAFDAKAQALNGEMIPKHVRATFVRDADGQYRVQNFKTFNILSKNSEEPIPGAP